MALSDATVRNAKPREKPYKLGDSGGLFLLVQPTGGRLWRLKYRIDGKEKKLALGTYPEVSLAVARSKRDEARTLIAAGKDPAIQKAREKAERKVSSENTFAAVAKEYIAKRQKEGWAESTNTKSEWFLSILEPAIGKLPVAEIRPTDVLPVLKRVEGKGNRETARRLLQFSSQVLRYAVATARLSSDPTRDLRGALVAPKSKHHGAILAPIKVGELLRSIDGYEGNHVTLYALKLSPHVFVRPGELRHADWTEIDLEEAL